ncbi:hypothetical protein F2Q68_00034906 [Brassica cretica]|uniref:Uncharacterized protein n=1 Tax=Brassica cretica TaxID=69181 RepID=A0A8S9HAM3_BRACR|nr:hypothetical protein F2Q68_00034906 [Brassica cretica]
MIKITFFFLSHFLCAGYERASNDGVQTGDDNDARLHPLSLSLRPSTQISPVTSPPPLRLAVAPPSAAALSTTEILRKFSEKNTRRSGTYLCVDKGVTYVVIKAAKVDLRQVEFSENSLLVAKSSMLRNEVGRGKCQTRFAKLLAR